MSRIATAALLLLLTASAVEAQTVPPQTLSTWTTPTRPPLPWPGQLGFNLNLGNWEWWNQQTNVWTNPSNVAIGGDITNSTVFSRLMSQRQFTGQLFDQMLTKTGDATNAQVIVNGVSYTLGDALSGAVAVGGGGTPTPAVSTDVSINKPNLTALNLLTTVPADNTRVGGCDIQNQSIAIITVVFDDGTGNNLSVIILGAASAAGGEGASFTCSFSANGRIRLYARTTDPGNPQVMMRIW